MVNIKYNVELYNFIHIIWRSFLLNWYPVILDHAVATAFQILAMDQKKQKTLKRTAKYQKLWTETSLEIPGSLVLPCRNRILK